MEEVIISQELSESQGDEIGEALAAYALVIQ